MADDSKRSVEQVEMFEDPEKRDEGVSLDAPTDPVTRKLERRLKWKLDFYILSIISIVYFFSSLGRVDLANAKIAGLSQELKLSAKDYSNAANTFLVGYIAFQLPGTLLLKQIGPNWQFGGAMLMWGLFTCLTILVTNAPALLGMRFLVGVAEAFVQGSVFYLSFWYTYDELSTRGAIVFSTSALAGAFNGLLSYGIAKDLNGKNGWLAWKWIFLIEGVTPIFVSFFVTVLLPPSPETVKFGFTQEELELAKRRASRAHNEPEAKFEWKKVFSPLFEVYFWLLTVCYGAAHFCSGSLSNFVPSIISGFGYSFVRAQLMSVVVYAAAFVGILFWCRLSDITQARGLTFAACSFVSALGYGLLIGLTGDSARLAATCIAAFGGYPIIVLSLSWIAMSTAGYTKRGASTAWLNAFSQMAAIGGNSAFTDPPYYKKGITTSFILMVICGLSALVLSYYFRRENAKKVRDQYTEKSNALRLKTVYELGDHHPDFFYAV